MVSKRKPPSRVREIELQRMLFPLYIIVYTICAPGVHKPVASLSSNAPSNVATRIFLH